MDGGRPFDVAVIGAGLSGIAFARFYLDTHPESRMVLLEKDRCLGGVWSQDRVFDHFWTQSPLRMTSFADEPLVLPPDAPTEHDTFPAKHVTQYFEAYVDSHRYAGRSLRERIQFETEVIRVEKARDGWMLHVAAPRERVVLQCLRLAIASGATSLPAMPSFPRAPDWTAPVLHHRDFGVREAELMGPASTYQNFTVLGGGKSAADLVYAAVKAHKSVSWIVRRSGEGPGIFMNPAIDGRYRNRAEAGATRAAAEYNPSGFRPPSAAAQQLHQCKSNRSELEDKLFASDRRFKAWPKFRGRQGALPGFAYLEPTASFFWNNGPVGMIQHDDFWDLISRKVNIYRADPTGTNGEAVVLDDGREVPTDVLLCGTGWLVTYPFLPAPLVCELGLGHLCQEKAEEQQQWQLLEDAADRQILETYPILDSPPENSVLPAAIRDHTPVRLYQGIAPLTDPSVLFLGRPRLSNSFRGAEAQAIWATAYWDGHVKLPPLAKAQQEVAYMNAFSRRRYPSRGFDGVNFHTDLIWYTDELISQAGLSSHRQKSWWTDEDAPCLASDLCECKDEYLEKYGSDFRDK